MSDLQVSKVNDVYCRVDGDISALRELVDYFTFRVPGCEFMPAYKAKMWDGNIKLYDPNKRTLYMGLAPYIDKFAQGEWTVEYEDNVFNYGKKSNETIEELCKVINPHSNGDQIEHRDYQIDGIGVAMNKKRSLLLSPTGSGKSLIIYTLIRYYEHILNKEHKGKKILIIVPTTSLVRQMFSDFDDYSSEDKLWNADEKCHIVFQGQDKIDYEKPVVISTWQSIYKMQKPYFKNYGAVIGDECLHPETMITMSDESIKPIKDIVIGDYVKTFNEKSKKIENNKVIKVHKNISNEKMYEVCGKNGEIIKITGNHKVLLESGVWKRVDELVNGDIVNTFNR